MRTGVIVAFVLVAATPAYASKSCMTKAEARQQFATSHLYWHGPGHCWDATTPRYRVAHRLKPKQDRQVRAVDREANSQEPTWRNAMSELLPSDAAVEELSAPAPLAEDEFQVVNWLDRWVDLIQATSPAVMDRMDERADASPTTGRTANPAITPMRLILMFLFVTLAAIALLFRNVIHDWRSNGAAWQQP
jgi:hypothetical protein